jgi:hypothetical protein
VKHSKTQEAFLAVAGTPCETITELIEKLDSAGYWGKSPKTHEEKLKHVQRRFRTLKDADGQPLFNKMPRKIFRTSYENFRSTSEEARKRFMDSWSLASRFSSEWTESERDYANEFFRLVDAWGEGAMTSMEHSAENHRLMREADDNAAIN